MPGLYAVSAAFPSAATGGFPFGGPAFFYLAHASLRALSALPFPPIAFQD